MLDLTLTPDDMSDLVAGRSITTIATDGTELAVARSEEWFGASLEDWALAYVSDLDVPDGVDTNSESFKAWAQENAQAMGSHLARAVEGYCMDMDPPPSNDEEE